VRYDADRQTINTTHTGRGAETGTPQPTEFLKRADHALYTPPQGAACTSD